ncbi:MAG: hypothetical protein KGI89_12585 [Euryarchaeota archaeon]|nr:hypothetical protein [Euryarchaeota archaeon]
MMATGLASVFGSEARARILVVLASARRDLSGYRIAKLSDVQPIKVSMELDRLARAGLVEPRALERKGRGWRLRDEDLRSFLSKRARVSWSEDWLDRGVNGIDATEELRERIRDLPPPNLSKLSWRRGPPPILRDFERPPEKDRALRAVGLATSLRGHPTPRRLRRRER